MLVRLGLEAWPKISAELRSTDVVHSAQLRSTLFHENVYKSVTSAEVPISTVFTVMCLKSS